MATFGFFRND